MEAEFNEINIIPKVIEIIPNIPVKFILSSKTKYAINKVKMGEQETSAETIEDSCFCNT